jgi:hypothetical protein
LKFGARLRDLQETNNATSNFNGTFTFASPATYEANQPIQCTLTTGIPGGVFESVRRGFNTFKTIGAGDAM